MSPESAPVRVLLLGAGGFSGRTFRALAEAEGLDVVGSARTPGSSDLVCDLLEPESLEAAIRSSRPDWVVNLAGSASVAESFRIPRAAFEANALGVLNLLQAVAGNAPAAPVLCISSGDVYGDVSAADLPADEQCPIAPLTPYAASKAAMEAVCGQFARSGELRIAAARSFNHTGPGQSDTFAASSFARQVVEAERDQASTAVLEVGNLEPLRDFTDVRDAPGPTSRAANRQPGGLARLGVRARVR